MGAFDGFWVNGDTARGHTVSDHAMDVMYQPQKYGMTPADVHKITGGKTTIATGDTSPESARGKLVIAAAKNGWARVRAFRGSYTVQLHGNAASRLPRVMSFLTKNGMHRNSDITVHDLSTGFHQKYEGVSGVSKAIRNSEIPDTLSTQEVGAEAQAMGAKGAALGVPMHIPDNQQRQILRQQLMRRAGLPEGQKRNPKLLAEGVVRRLRSRS